MMRSSVFKQRSVLGILVLVLANIACFCSTSPQTACWNTYATVDETPSEEFMEGCTQSVFEACGNYTGSEMDPQSVQAHSNCAYAAANAYGGSQALSSSTGNCGTFRLTSPLDGMANGTNTFYWDPLAGATGYSVEIYHENQLRATFTANSSQTNMTVDISSGSVGEGVIFLVRVKAFVGPNVACSRDYLIARAALPNAPQNNIIAPPIDPAAPPAPYCGDGICETYELSGPLHCSVDCDPH